MRRTLLVAAVVVSLLAVVGSSEVAQADGAAGDRFAHVVDGGFATTCAITADQGVACWGTGYLGDGTDGSSPTPVAVTGVADVVQVSAKGSTTCARQVDGAVLCWGRNFRGQAGVGTTEPVPTPTVVPLPGAAIDISVGADHTCALVVGGGAHCWGYNGLYALGNGTNDDETSPIPVAVPWAFTSIAAGRGFTCAIDTETAVRCWGSDGWGSLGNGAASDVRIAANATPAIASGASSVSAGNVQACAVMDTGEVRCWGANSAGQAGTGTAQTVPSPQLIAGLADVDQLALGEEHSCAKTTAGSVSCWGTNADAQLGTADKRSSRTPLAVVGATSGVRAIGAGYDHTCVLRDDASMYCWGDTADHRLGANPDLVEATPTAPTGITAGATSVSTGPGLTCAIVAGAASCWGDGIEGQLGTGPTTLFGPVKDTISTVPLALPGLASSGLTSVSASSGHACAVASSGAVVCWGSTVDGRLASGSVPLMPFSVPASPSVGGTVTAVSAGANHTCAVVNGGARCWGGNSSGQLGNLSTTSTTYAVTPTGLTSGIAGVAAGTRSSCALRTTGTVWCWGSNSHGELGLGNLSTPWAPTQVVGISDATSISMGPDHTCATVSGGVACWGRNSEGQIGDGTTTDRRAPVLVPGTEGATQVQAGGTHTCALVAPQVLCWGTSASAASTTPVPVAGLPDDVDSIGQGSGASTCATTESGRLLCWGTRDVAEIGDGIWASKATIETEVPFYDGNRKPVPSSASLTVARGGTRTFALQASDADGDDLTYAVTVPPAMGDLSCGGPTGAACTYVAPSGWSGSDPFTFSVTDGRSAPVAGTGSIVVAAPRVSVGDAQVLEAESGPVGVFVPFTLSSPVSDDVVISFHTVNGTAVHPSDYQRSGTASQPAKVRIKAGETWATTGITVLSDAVVEPDEQFGVQIVSVAASEPIDVRDGTATVSIVDTVQSSDDPLLSVLNATLHEGDQGTMRAQFPIRLSKPAATSFTITVHTADATAIAGADYRPLAPRTIVVPAGARTVMVDVAVFGDHEVEGDETFHLVVVPSSGAPVIQLDPSGTQVIVDDDA